MGGLYFSRRWFLGGITIEITREQQYLISLQALKLRTQDAKRLYNKYMFQAGDTTWDDLDKKIRELLVDLNYRGDLGHAPRNKIDDAISTNDLKAMCAAMSDAEFWVLPRKSGGQEVSSERFGKRRDLACK